MSSASSAAEVRVEGALVTIIEHAEVPARDAGVLLELAPSAGDTVKSGQVLGKIEDDDARIALKKAEAEATIAEAKALNDVDVRYAKKAAEVAQSELRRARESVERVERSISKTEMDKLVLEAERGVLAVEEAEHELQIARQTWNLKKTEVEAAKQVVDRRRITSPLDGVVVEIHRRRGEWVKPGDPVFRLLRIDRLRIESFVAAEQVAGSDVGRAVTFQYGVSGAAPRTYPGKLVFVSPEVDPVNGQIRVWAEVENRDQSLRPGVRGMLVVPAAAAP
jgi:macrolide-specific efflux system membrane fusion protein